MKKTITVLCIAMLCVCLSSCTTETTSKKTDADFSKYIPLYNEVLQRQYDIISEPKKVLYPGEGETGITEAARALENNAMDTIGYAFADINNDDVPELIVGASNPDYYSHVKNEIYALYGLKNEIPTFIIEGTARSIYSITDDNKLYYYGSGGAMHSIFAMYTMSPELELECENYYFTHQKDDNVCEIGYYHNRKGEFEKKLSEELNIRPEAFWNIEQGYADKTINIEFTPFSQYKSN